MTLDPVTAAFLSGLILGNRPMPTPELVDDLRERKPSFYEVVDIDLSTARTDEEYKKAGNFIWVDNQYGVGKATIRLNEPDKEKLDLLRQKFISGPFYRFFITNLAGRGKLRLIISRGYSFASEPIESVTLAELAARLGSPVTFDRRGDVVWLDDFEDGLSKWDPTSIGLGASFEWSAARARNGGFCGKVEFPASLSTVQINRRSPYAAQTKVGLEFSAIIGGLGTGFDRIQFGFWVYDGTTLYTAMAEYDHANTKVEIYSPDLTWFDLETGFSLSEQDYMFHTFKLVFDTATGKYVRLLIDGNSWDLTAHALSGSTTSAKPQLNAQLVFRGTSDIVYMDGAIVTQNES